MGIKRQSPGKWQVFSETGVGAGYKLHTYTPGTTDNKLTHTNKDGSADNTNPVIFDSRGEADIWFNGTYDLKLVDNNDNLIWTLSDFGEGEDQVNYGNYNLINDGGFEDDTNGDGLPDQWSVTAYPTGGTGAGVAVIDTTDQIEGAQSLKFTSVGDGGGYAVSNFFNVREGGQIAAAWLMKSTSAAVRNVVEVIWYTGAKVQISTSSLYDDSTTNPTSWTQKNGSVTAVTNARFAKLRIYGCHSSDATAGDTWYDAVQVVSDTIFGDLTIVNDMAVGNDLTVSNNATVSGVLNAAGTLRISGSAVTAAAAELNYNDITTLGTAQASKTVTTDASKDITGLNSVTSASFVGALTGNATTAGTITSQGALATLDSVAAAQIDWANTIGITQMLIHQKESIFAATTNFVDIGDEGYFSFYVSASMNSVDAYVEGNRDGGVDNGIIKVYIGAAAALVYVGSASYVYGTGTIDVSALSGWQEGYIEVSSSTNPQNVAIRRVTLVAK